MLAQDKITSIYYMVDELLKASSLKGNNKRIMSDSEVITVAVIACLYFGGHLEHAMSFMKMTGNIPNMLSKSRFNRRLHKLESVLFEVFFQLGDALKSLLGASDYILDSFPVAVCDNMRIARSRIVKGKQYRGRHSSMRRYFYGIKVQVLSTCRGIPVECCFVPGSEADIYALKRLPLSVASESNIYADAAYTDYSIEDDIAQGEQIRLRVARKSNAQRKDTPWLAFLKNYMRKPIETAFSELTALFPRNIHAVTFKGFLLKILLFVFAYALKKIIP